MVDIFSSHKRHEIMSRIGAKNTKPELRVRKVLHSLGYRFRLHCKGLPGTPDIVLPRWRSVIFVHGCFWHSHSGCKRANIPKTNTEFWISKIAGNIARDAKAIEQLQELGYKCLVIWECETQKLDQVAERLMAFLPR